MQTLINRAGWVLAAIISVTVLAALAGIVHGGPLDPPAAPSSTDGVLEPGTPISSLPFVISQPGSYYLTRDLTGVSGQNGIEIAAPNVTLDLKGFTLQGVGDDLDAVHVDDAIGDFTVRDGVITGWGGSGVAVAVQTLSAEDYVYDLKVNSNAGAGVVVGDRASIHDVIAQSNGLGGILASRSSVVQHCIVTDNTGDGIVAPFDAVISDNSLKNNTGVGIKAGQNSVVRSNSVESSGGDGIDISATSIVEQNVVLLNGQLVADGAAVHATGAFNRIANNQFSNNDRGVWAPMSPSVIIGNQSEDGDPFGQVASGNLLGPVVSAGTIGSAGANPFANFQ